MKTLSIEYLRECFKYDADTGVLTWLERPRSHFGSDCGWNLFNAKFPGKSAGTLSKSTGYIVINLHGSLFGAHRIAWALHNETWPADHIDHCDGARSSNKIENLRLCKRSENQCNRRKQSNNRSGFKGVYLHSNGVWRARIQRDGRLTELGLFKSPEEAHAAYSTAAQQLHGEFACIG